MAQSFIPKTSTILYSITEKISEILEREKILQKHQSSIIYSFIFIHSLMSGNGISVHLIVCDFHTK